jgi:putative sigma-54 modulation protein
MAMKVEINARNLELADQLKDYITKKASKLDRYLNEIDHTRVELTYSKSARNNKERNVAQITVHGHRVLLRVEERSDEIKAAFDTAIDKMQRQLERYKGQHSHGRGDGRSAAEISALPVEAAGEEKRLIARHKTFD